MEPIAEAKRMGLIDVARFYAMALVFYGHFIERIMMLKNPAAATQYKFIYSFHMMLFFLLAGYVVQESYTEFSFGKYLKHRFMSRLLPFLFFTAIFMLLPMFFSGDFNNLPLPSVKGYIYGLLMTLFGLPMFCIPSWFVLMIFSVEIVHYVAFRFLKSSNLKILIGALLFYVAGYWLNLEFDIVNLMKRRLVGYNYLFIHEAITMYAFYLLGIYLRRKQFLMEKVSPKIVIPGVIVMFLIVLFTFKLNNGPFNFSYYNSVVIMFSSHGNFIWFPITAVSGSFFILFLAKVTPSQKTILLIGENALIFMCLNGIFYHYINFRVAKWVVTHLSGSFLTILGVGCVMTVASLAVCIPLVYLFDKFVPQLVGKPKIDGPWLRNLI
jgi:acyltransferase